MNLNAEYEVAIQRIINFLGEFTKKAKAVTCSSTEKLIEDLNVFRTLIEKEIRTTPMMQYTYELKICNSQENLKRALKDIEHLHVLLEEERSKFDNLKRGLITDITKEESMLRSIKEMSKKHMAEQTKISEEKMLTTREEHRLRMELLEKEINSFSEEIRLKTVENTAREEVLQKIHLQTQKRSIELIAKYDRDIGAKYRLIEKMTLQNNCLKEKQEELRTRLANQNELYIRLREEREQAIMKAFVEGLENFRRNRAAKVIQRTWRCYRERLLLKKKKKTKKK